MPRKRAIVLMGAGVSFDYGAPLTKPLSDTIQAVVTRDGVAKQTGAAAAFVKIRNKLKTYLEAEPNFEQIYHCAHELLEMHAPSPGAAEEFRPLLFPFLAGRGQISRLSLASLLDKIVDVIFDQITAACANNAVSLTPLKGFISGLRTNFTTRIYTTNYDDLVYQAAPDLYTGFDGTPRPEAKRFQLDRFWEADEADSLFHLHGSVHMGFPHPPPGGDLGELCWYDDRAEARKYASFKGSGVRRMDGTEFIRTAVITGLDKLSRLQQRPFAHFYAALAQDLMRADCIFVIGSGLADLHLNTWLKEARSRERKPPLLFVDKWGEHGFMAAAMFDHCRREIEMFHALGIHIAGPADAHELGKGWLVARDGSAAVWERGFQAFLEADKELENVLGMLGCASPAES